MGLTKKQIKDMLPSEVDEYCDKVIRKRLDDKSNDKSNEEKE
jgi:hypothetical protein